MKIIRKLQSIKYALPLLGLLLTVTASAGYVATKNSSQPLITPSSYHASPNANTPLSPEKVAAVKSSQPTSGSSTTTPTTVAKGSTPTPTSTQAKPTSVAATTPLPMYSHTSGSGYCLITYNTAGTNQPIYYGGDVFYIKKDYTTNCDAPTQPPATQSPTTTPTTTQPSTPCNCNVTNTNSTAPNTTAVTNPNVHN